MIETYTVGLFCSVRMALELRTVRCKDKSKNISALPDQKIRFRTNPKIIRRQCRSQLRDIFGYGIVGNDNVCHVHTTNIRIRLTGIIPFPCVGGFSYESWLGAGIFFVREGPSNNDK